MSDALAAQAREAHREADASSRAAEQARARRDRIVRQLRADDPDRWTLGALAHAVGCSRSLIVKILNTGSCEPR